MLFQLFQNARTAGRWVKALSLASQKRYEDALDYVILVERDTKIFPSSKYSTYAQLLKALLLEELGKDAEAAKAIKLGLSALNQYKTPNDEVKYLKCYALSLFARLKIDVNSNLKLEREIEKAFVRELDLARVPRNVKRNFPLRNHPAWTEN